MNDEKGRVFGVWYGGGSYSSGGVESDLETWEDITEAKGALLDRYRHGHWEEQTFSYVNKEAESVRCPAVDETTEIHLWYGNPLEGDYPDSVIRLRFNDDDEAVAYVESV